MLSITGVAHVELSVRDLEISAAWYSSVFGMSRFHEGRNDERQIVDVALRDPISGVVLGLTRHRANRGESFDAARTGLDHLCFAVADRDQLRAWQARFADLGADYTPLVELDQSATVTARDPDGIALEFYVRGAAR